MAVTASALMAAADHPGPLLIAHLAILTIARDADGEPLAESDWIAIRGLLACLADLLESPETGTLDPLGSDWREWKRPAALR
ncbi:MAG: hypothetical protein H7144_15630 [Burkholderiales bacterium]|nr:hypothetical protein [Phycisphaerae bacterium]